MPQRYAELLLTAGFLDIFPPAPGRGRYATAFAMSDLQLPEIGRCDFLTVERALSTG